MRTALRRPASSFSAGPSIRTFPRRVARSRSPTRPSVSQWCPSWRDDIRARASSTPAATHRFLVVVRLRRPMRRNCSQASASRPGVLRSKRARATRWRTRIYTKAMVAPKPGERWVMITSAFHMPRAMAAFRGVGFDVEAFPVDWQIGDGSDLLWPFRSVCRRPWVHRHGGARVSRAALVSADRPVARAVPGAAVRLDAFPDDDPAPAGLQPQRKNGRL